MTSTAKRRWSREIESQIDGVAFEATGPVLMHGYDPPAGGKWLDNVIPGKLGAIDRNTGELVWMGPCEVGYGRGFGAGVDANSDAVILGPASGGHLIARTSIEDGELLDAAEIEFFDEARVYGDVSVCVSAARVFGVDTTRLTERWAYARNGERYHHIERLGDRVFVVFTHTDSKRQGVLCLDAETGHFDQVLIAPSHTKIRQIAVTGDSLVLLTAGLEDMLPGECLVDYATQVGEFGAGETDSLSLVVLRPDGEPGDAPVWFQVLETCAPDDLPDCSISADSGKLYLVRGAYLEVLDAVSGRSLGNWTVPGLDEQVAWLVVDGAGLLAEETRISVFELPA